MQPLTGSPTSHDPLPNHPLLAGASVVALVSLAGYALTVPGVLVTMVAIAVSFTLPGLLLYLVIRALGALSTRVDRPAGRRCSADRSGRSPRDTTGS